MSLLMVAAREAGGEVHVVMDDDERVEFILATSGETRPVTVVPGVSAPPTAGVGRGPIRRLPRSLLLATVLFAAIAAVAVAGVLWVAPWTSDDAPGPVDDAEPVAATQSPTPAVTTPSPTETASDPAKKRLVRVRARVTTRPGGLRFELISDRDVVVRVRLSRRAAGASGILRRARLITDRSTTLALRDLEPGVWRWVVVQVGRHAARPVRGTLTVTAPPSRPTSTPSPTPTTASPSEPTSSPTTAPTPTPRPTTAQPTPAPTPRPTKKPIKPNGDGPTKPGQDGPIKP